MADGRAPVVIVGGGFSGTMVAANLASRGIRSFLIEANGLAGQGAAYSTKAPAHLLNIRANNMGAWADDPGHFAAAEGIEPDSFAQRRRYGRYLRAILRQSIDKGLVQLIDARAVEASQDATGWHIRLEDGGVVDSRALVLATGNQPPAELPFAKEAGDRLINNPWGEAAQSAISDAASAGHDVLIVGTSLTMVDTVLSLDEAGHRGAIVALSRRGKIPLAGGLHDPAPVEWTELPPLKVREFAKWLRNRARLVDWRSAIDSLRPHSHRIWQSFSMEEKRRFLRFGRPWWGIHRHRIAPEVAAKVAKLVSERRLEIVAGRIVMVEPKNGGLAVTIRRRGKAKAEPPRLFGHIFNCTGPLADIRRTGEPLLRQLLDDGLVRPDELSIGFAVDERSRAGPAERLWALGTLTKGRYWEMIAVPDIREQAAAVAEDIAVELGR
ncbi:MAG TPA: FAD/NAD(P)-binding protein [Sphingomicrobium sp.]|nr:FAD/NAD(P)-binding protein [Sphingomicrobium sp.]